ncbi:MAG: hypothetical protein IJ991_10370 [Thermoguttaceae bacterium]|nr:hypothetical protein [Thermoguttaceae bacterium]
MNVKHWKKRLEKRFFVATLAISTAFFIASSAVVSASPDVWRPKIAYTMNDLHRATCRVAAIDKATGRGAYGTGQAIGYDPERDVYTVHTNYHVVDGFGVVDLHWFGEGARRIDTPGVRVVATFYDEKAPVDSAFVEIPRAAFGGYDPPILPFLPYGTKIPPGTAIMSCGCSEGRWAAAWRGGVESYYGRTAQFYPAPKGGQSGSAIVVATPNGLRIALILTYRVGDERTTPEEQMRGGALPIDAIYDAASGRRPTGEIDSIPPNAVFASTAVARVEDETLSPAPPIRRCPFDARLLASPAAATASSRFWYEAFYFSTPNCAACDAASPAVDALTAQGFPIRRFSTATPDGAKAARDFRIALFPTVVFVRRDDSGRLSELERWYGTENFELRLRDAFRRASALRAPPGSIPVPSRPTGSLRFAPIRPAAFVVDAPTDSPLPPSNSVAPLDLEIDATLETLDQPKAGAPEPTPAEPLGPGSDAIEPVSTAADSTRDLLDLYRGGFEGYNDEPSPVSPPCPETPSEPAPDVAAGPIRGAIDRAANAALESIVARATAKIDALAAEAQERLDAAEAEARSAAVALCGRIAFWGAFGVAAWYWLVRGLASLAGRLPKIKFEQAEKST